MALRTGTNSKKNDMMSQQIANSLKMSAYLNKNTFSSSTALPPEENRLNMSDILSKSAGPIWKKKEKVIRRHYKNFGPSRHSTDDVFSSKKHSTVASCRLCGQGKIFY